jgi:hypothetical protein
LFLGVSSIKRWGLIHKHVFNDTTKKTLNKELEDMKSKPTLFSANPGHDNSELKELKKELIGINTFLKHYVVDISWLEQDNKTSKKDDRKTSEKDDKKTLEDDKKTSEEDDRKTSEEDDRKTSEEDDKKTSEEDDRKTSEEDDKSK